MKPIARISLVIVITVLVVVGGVYLWQEGQLVEPSQSTRPYLNYTDRNSGYSVKFRKGTQLCVPAGDGEDCNQTPGNDITEREYPYFKHGEVGAGGTFIEISRNKLSMNAVAFAKRSLATAQRVRQNDYYSNVREISFHGTQAFTFIAEKGWGEFGRVYDNDGASIDFGNAEGISMVLEQTYRVIYFDHNEFLFRIMYPKDDKDAVAIIESFEFLK